MCCITGRHVLLGYPLLTTMMPRSPTKTSEDLTRQLNLLKIKNILFKQIIAESLGPQFLPPFAEATRDAEAIRNAK